MHIPEKMSLQRLWSNEMSLKRTTQKEMALRLLTTGCYSQIVAAATTIPGMIAARARRARLAAGALIVAENARATVLRTAAAATSGAGPTSASIASRSWTLYVVACQ